MKTLHSSLLLIALVGVGSSAFADFITGTVLGSNGAPAAGVNIDAIRLSNGNNIKLQNDGTNSAGFFNTTIPADVYDLWFFPPAGSSDVTLVLHNVVVSGTKNLGTLHLVAGSLVSGHVQKQNGTPVGGLDLHVIDNATGLEVPLLERRTDAFGNFSVAAPKNSIDLNFDTTNLAPTVLLGAKSMTLTPTTNTNVGTIVLPPGFTVTGHVQRTSNGLAVSAVDLNFKDLATGLKAYTPNDNTDAAGNFSVIVAAATYNIDFAAPFATHLAGKRLANHVVSASHSVGTLTLDDGVVMSGTVKSFDNVAQLNADVDVFDQAGTLIPTANDNTSASGAYQVIVPFGTLKIIFRPPSYAALISDVHAGVLVSANFTLNGTLPAWAGANNYGAGMAGTGGFVPHVTVSGGTSRTGNPDFAFELQNGRGGALAVVEISTSSISAPFLGGTLLVKIGHANAVSVITTLGGAAGVGGAGSKHLLSPFPLGLSEGLDLYTQFAVRDPATTRGWCLSDAVHFKVVP